jgi:hypothetical protein
MLFCKFAPAWALTVIAYVPGGVVTIPPPWGGDDGVEPPPPHDAQRINIRAKAIVCKRRSRGFHLNRNKKQMTVSPASSSKGASHVIGGKRSCGRKPISELLDVVTVSVVPTGSVPSIVTAGGEN